MGATGTGEGPVTVAPTAPTAWQGELTLEFAPVVESGEPLGATPSPPTLSSTKTQIVHRYAKAPLKVQRPFYPEGPSVCHSVMVHTAGGMVGGDRLQIAVQAHPQAQALMTTAAASKAYGKTNAVATQSVRLQVGAGACLEWLPQELILFDGARYQQDLRVDLAPDAVWLGWDITRLGRTLRGERFTAGEWRSHLEVWQQGRPLWVDPQGIQGGTEMMASGHGLNHCSVIGTFALMGREITPDVVTQVRDRWHQCPPSTNTLVIPNPGPESTNSQHHQHHPSQIGVSRLQSGLVCRYRGHSTLEARRWFMAVWQILRPIYLARPACPPRVWPESQRVSSQ